MGKNVYYWGKPSKAPKFTPRAGFANWRNIKKLARKESQKQAAKLGEDNG